MDSYEHRFAAGEAPETLDKDFIRRWVAARCDPYRDPIPEIPSEIVLETARIYIDAYEAITGQPFEMPPSEVPVLERIRANLRKYFPSDASNRTAIG
jgi:phosphoribosylaminoimidazole-succinocarboxamide synthase